MVKEKIKSQISKLTRAKQSVNRLYRRSAPLFIAEAILFIGIAVWMLFRPVAMLTAMTLIIGVALVIFGLYRTIAGFSVSRQIGGGGMDMLFGLVNIVLGVLFCIYPIGSIISIVYIFVILFLFKALRALVLAINMARVRFGHYVFDIIMSLGLVALAVLALFYPVAGAIAVVYYIAATMLIYAASDIFMYVELWKLRRHIGEMN